MPTDTRSAAVGRKGIERSCDLVKVSRAGYYRHWQASRPRQEETALRDEIQRLSLANKLQGHRPLTVLLKRAGWIVSHKRVQRIRREDNLLCVTGRTFRPATTDARHQWQLWPNLARDLMATTVNQLWIADITYVRLNEAFVYLAVGLDAFSRKVVGWAMADHLRAELAPEAYEASPAPVAAAVCGWFPCLTQGAVQLIRVHPCASVVENPCNATHITVSPNATQSPPIAYRDVPVTPAPALVHHLPTDDLPVPGASTKWS